MWKASFSLQHQTWCKCNLRAHTSQVVAYRAEARMYLHPGPERGCTEKVVSIYWFWGFLITCSRTTAIVVKRFQRGIVALAIGRVHVACLCSCSCMSNCTVLRSRKYIVLEDSTERPHFLNKVDFRGQTYTIQISSFQMLVSLYFSCVCMHVFVFVPVIFQSFNPGLQLWCWARNHWTVMTIWFWEVTC